MAGRVLYVDDDANLLASVKRQQRNRFELVLVEQPTEAIQMLTRGDVFDVIVSDLRMPGMDGFELLGQAAQLAPDATRILLTGAADLETAKRAVNEGHVFRFLTKPCVPEELGGALRAGIEFHDLKVAQRELLERTLRGAVQVLADVLGLVNPAAFGRASRVTRYVKAIAEQLKLPEAWRYEIAALLSQVGCVTVPPAIVEKLNAGLSLDLAERRMMADHPRVAQQLLAGIPRLEEVAEMVRYQNERFNPPSSPLVGEAAAPEQIPLGARILKVALDLDWHEKKEASRAAAVEKLMSRKDWYDPKVLEVLEAALGAGPVIMEIDVDRLEVDMIVAEDIRTADGLLLVSSGQRVNVGMIERLQNWARRSERSIAQRVTVTIPAAQQTGEVAASG